VVSGWSRGQRKRTLATGYKISREGERTEYGKEKGRAETTISRQGTVKSGDNGVGGEKNSYGSKLRLL